MRAACDRHGSLLIFDEVACGFGRTGTLCATEHCDVQPDILCMTTALTGGATRMGATIMTDDVYDAISDEGFEFYERSQPRPRRARRRVLSP